MRRALYIFSNDLRLDDNPALHYALSADQVCLIFYRDLSSSWLLQGAAAWWLNENLKSLSKSLEEHKLRLVFVSGNGHSSSSLHSIIEESECNEICIARAYTKHERSLQKNLHQHCKEKNIAFKRFPSTLLFEPEDIINKQGSFYRVFTPFYKACLVKQLRKPKSFSLNKVPTEINLTGESLEDWELQPSKPDWSKPLANCWQAGEKAASGKLKKCQKNILRQYQEGRNELSEELTSGLSPYLSLGVISPSRIWEDISSCSHEEESQPWLRQLIWREFNAHLLFHNPEIDTDNYQQKFANFPWRHDAQLIEAWQKGQTGYPIIDAAMQELWQTGWMHNRARMIVASFLTKHLQQHWQEGARWFWDTLIDADLANNSGGWQWTAGCGADAAPYFRIFNPITQGQKFDKHGNYVRRWLPNLSKLPNKYLFSPWEAPIEILEQAGVELGENYPHPIVDHKYARERALAAYSQIKQSTAS